ncbi:MAG: DUF4437 domain-containing protein [Alphaproteobacteria bacterium]|nr:DUF4437 domain-containing protein [Alphaproteobacteria bacterium]
MGRPHIEFIASQQLPWRSGLPGGARDDCQVKILSIDPERGDCSVLIRYPAGWERGPETLAAAEEMFVLDGEIDIDGRRYGPHCFGFLPAGFRRGTARSERGAVALTFFSALPAVARPSSAPVSEAATFIDAVQMAWDTSDIDPGLAFMGIRRKTLRVDPATGQRCTFLIATAPHNHPKDWKCATLTHPCVEECFMLAGDLTGPQGVIGVGGYFWRPAGIPHGPFGSLNGSLSLIRFVYGKHINVWGNEEISYTFSPPHRPILPPELATLGVSPYLGGLPY